MLNETEARNAVVAGAILRDFDDETGKAVDVDTDGETVAVRLEGENFSRWSDALDLDYV